MAVGHDRPAVVGRAAPATAAPIVPEAPSTTATARAGSGLSGVAVGSAHASPQSSVRPFFHTNRCSEADGPHSRHAASGQRRRGGRRGRRPRPPATSAPPPRRSAASPAVRTSPGPVGVSTGTDGSRRVQSPPPRPASATGAMAGVWYGAPTGSCAVGVGRDGQVGDERRERGASWPTTMQSAGPLRPTTHNVEAGGRRLGPRRAAGGSSTPSSRPARAAAWRAARPAGATRSRASSSAAPRPRPGP